MKKATKAASARTLARVAAANVKARRVAQLARAWDATPLSVSAAAGPASRRARAEHSYGIVHAVVFAVVPGLQNDTNADPELRKAITAASRKIRGFK